MGFDLTQVISDDKHYGAFICRLCESLVSLDAVVTTSCSHPFCRSCLADWAKKQTDNGMTCTCPTCQRDLTANPSNGEQTSINCLRIGTTSIMAQSLGEAQPLAYAVLTMVQVACTGGDNSDDCDWTGDYGDWGRHRSDAHGDKRAMDSSNQRQQFTRSLSQPSIISTQSAQPQAGAVDPESEGPFNGAETANSRMQLQRGNSTRLPQNDASNSDFQRQHKSANDLDHDDEDDDHAYQNANPSRKLLNGAHGSDPPERSESHELDVSYGDMDWIQGNNPQRNQLSPTKPMQPIAAVDEDKSQGYQMDAQQEEEEEEAEELSAEAIERSEKLKKQANAKFNKGDFEGARSLYSDGLDVITSVRTATKEQAELVATLYSNRAVTYFREKEFNKCIEDCDKALEYEPTYEKSYIRKWRALMALGNFEEACDCLERAHQEIPSSNRVKQELIKAREQKEVLSLVNSMIDGGNLEKAKETIKPLAKESDNIGLLLVAAMADAGLGLTESALEKVNKALRFNPNHVEALQLRGLVLFLSGEMEKGVRLIQELHNRNPEHNEVQVKLDQCQNTLAAFSKGRGYAKRGRYKEAVEQFSEAMDERALPLPTGTALYCLIKMERAEALLLSKHYTEALRDCKDALESEPENAEAWALKAEIYMCLGRAAEAKEELADVRATWGTDNLVIDDAYRKANFEMKVRRVDDELMHLINDVENGVPEKVIIDGRGDGARDKGGGMHQSERRHGSSDRRSQMEKGQKQKSYRSINKASDRNLKSDRNRKDKHADRRSKRDRDRARTTEGSARTHGSQRTMNTNVTGVSSKTMNTRGTNGASHRAKRSGTKKKSSRNLKVEKDKV